MLTKVCNKYIALMQLYVDKKTLDNVIIYIYNGNVNINSVNQEREGDNISYIIGDFFSDDGKIIKGIITDPKKSKLKGGFGLFMQDGMIEISKLDLRGTDYKVLMYLLGILDFDNFLCISQQAVGDALGLKRQQVSLSIKRLVENEIIIRGNSVGNQNTYTINERFFVKGTKGKYVNERLDKPRMSNVFGKKSTTALPANFPDPIELYPEGDEI